MKPRGPEKCPQCGKDCPLYDWSEVDIGVGSMTYDHSWLCPEHGAFAFNEQGEPVMRDAEASS